MLAALLLIPFRMNVPSLMLVPPLPVDRPRHGQRVGVFLGDNVVTGSSTPTVIVLLNVRLPPAGVPGGGAEGDFHAAIGRAVQRHRPDNRVVAARVVDRAQTVGVGPSPLSTMCLLNWLVAW